MLTYRCNECGLQGSGTPHTFQCPNCKADMELKVRESEDRIISHGVFVPVSEIVEQLRNVGKAQTILCVKIKIPKRYKELCSHFLPEIEFEYE